MNNINTIPFTDTHTNAHTISIYDFCYYFLSTRSLISIEYVTSNDKLFEGTVQELLDTIDADLRTICSSTKIYRIVPELSLQKGTPLSICLLI